MLAVTQSHASRVLQFLRDGVGIPAHVLVGVETGADHYARGQKGGNVAVLLHATNNNGEELVRILSNLEVLTCAVVKAYVIDKNAPTTLEGSAAQISSLLKAKAIPPSAAIRVQTFPPSLLPTFLPQLETTNTKLNLNPHFVADGLVISLVQIPGLGGYRVSVADAFESTCSMRTSRSNSESSVSRAYFKLQEVLLRTQSQQESERICFEGAVAMDVGSAPGGWTKLLAVDKHCAKVFSVDPADLDPSVAKLENVFHLRSKIQDSLATISSELGLGKELDVLVSDMCPHNSSELVDVLRLLMGATPRLIRRGALVVFTFKALTGCSEATWDLLAREFVEEIEKEGWLQEEKTRVLHLMANRARERTLVGYCA